MSNFLKNKFNSFCSMPELFILTLVLLCTFGMVDQSFAQEAPAGGTGAAGSMLSGLTTMLGAITKEISGTLGKAIGICVVIGIGFMFLTGRMDWVSALMMIAGVAIIIGAAAISTQLLPAGAAA